MTTALVDADGIAWAAAYFTADLDESQAIYKTHTIVEDLLASLNSTDYILYLTGDNNFRYSIYPEYKAHRKEVPKPIHLALCKDVLHNDWKAVVSDGCEADDLIAIDHTARNHESLIVSVDKDFDQLYGWHYNPVKKLRYLVSPTDATRFFYYQLLVGDRADNIKGVDRVGPVKAERLLASGTDEQAWFILVREAYGCDAEMEMNAKCLWLWRTENDIWKWPEWAGEKDVSLEVS
jgi:5'-3' exonuclease